MFKFDRKKFFDAYRLRFGALTQDLVDAIEFLLSQIEKDTRFGTTDADRRQIAYCLATFKWETAHTMRPIDEYGTAAYFNSRYGPQTKVGKMLGNTQPGDGARFHGRGFVQLTGRANYTNAKKLTKVDLLADPDSAKNPDLAYLIAVQGMKDGWFTGARLKQFFKDNEPPDYENARTIVNDHDKAQLIADIARRLNEVLMAALS
jgi:hypothetical protein